MISPTERVAIAALMKREAEERYRVAIVESVVALQDAGARDAFAAVAKAAGVSRQAVRQMVDRAAS